MNCGMVMPDRTNRKREGKVGGGGGGGLTNVPPSQSALGNDCNTGKMSPKS